MYYDCNNLYGGPMTQPLAVGDYQWEDVSLWNEERIMNIDKTGERGYIFEVDLEYSKELHDTHTPYSYSNWFNYSIYTNSKDYIFMENPCLENCV